MNSTTSAWRAIDIEYQSSRASAGAGQTQSRNAGAKTHCPTTTSFPSRCPRRKSTSRWPSCEDLSSWTWRLLVLLHTPPVCNFLLDLGLLRTFSGLVVIRLKRLKRLKMLENFMASSYQKSRGNRMVPQCAKYTFHVSLHRTPRTDVVVRTWKLEEHKREGRRRVKRARAHTSESVCSFLSFACKPFLVCVVLSKSHCTFSPSTIPSSLMGN
jgi:hypothetical protein